MRLQDVLSRSLPEMAYARKKADLVITGLEKPINGHLLKLAALAVLGPQDEDARVHWREELVNWLDEVAEIRLKPTGRPASAEFYFSILFDEPFGGAEVTNMARRLRRLQRQHYPVLPDADPAALAERLRRFHRSFAEACARGAVTDLDIEAMVDGFTRGKPADSR